MMTWGLKIFWNRGDIGASSTALKRRRVGSILEIELMTTIFVKSNWPSTFVSKYKTIKLDLSMCHFMYSYHYAFYCYWKYWAQKALIMSLCKPASQQIRGYHEREFCFWEVYDDLMFAYILMWIKQTAHRVV